MNCSSINLSPLVNLAAGTAARSRHLAWRAVILGIALCQAANGYSQVMINEIMADNRSSVENGNSFPDYIELVNPSGQSISLAGLSLTDDPADPQQFLFPQGTSIPAGGRLVVWCDDAFSDPGMHTGFALGANGDRVRFLAANGVTVLDEVIFGLQVGDLSLGRIPDGTGNWALTQPTPSDANVSQPLAATAGLRINEWMARTEAGEDWIEVFNGQSLPAPLGGLVLTDETAGTPDNRAIPNLSFIGARGFVLFEASDLASPDADHLDFKISTDGETLTLLGANRATVIDRVTFGAQQTDVSQGRSPDGSDRIVSFVGGQVTPGEPNFGQLTSIVISEILSHTDPPFEDAIELHNESDETVDISHWWLSDEASKPKKFQIPPGTTLAPGGFVVFYEYQFGDGEDGFALNSYRGEEVYLSAADEAGTLTGLQTILPFGALKNSVSVGRHVTSVGVDYVPLAQRTFGRDNPSSVTEFRRGNGEPNAAPRIGPLVISEIMFQPPEVGGQVHEYLELRNIEDHSVPLYDPEFTTNSWRLRGGVSFDFPLNLTLSSGGYLLIVDFDPVQDPAVAADFRARYAVPEQVPLLGPFDGRLSDQGEVVELLWPDHPEGPESNEPGLVPYEMVERLHFQTTDPWPTGASGTGSSLHRSDTGAYANEPSHWEAGAPSPGRESDDESDTDGDGMPDAWELTHGFNPTDGGDAQEDADQDGAGNLEEFMAGTNPHDSDSVFAIESLVLEEGATMLTFPGVSGRTYTIEFREGFAAGDWLNLTNVGPVVETGLISIPLAMPANKRFYRLATP